MARDTVLSPCRLYRYTLWREFGSQVDERYVAFIGLNPSTADEVNDDPTIRRCVAYTKAWGFGALCMVNLFGLRATAPTVMLAADEPVGSDNDRHIVDVAKRASIVVAVWGKDGAHRGRAAEVCRLLPELHCLAITKLGQPGHPLYLKSNLRPVPL